MTFMHIFHDLERVEQLHDERIITIRETDPVVGKDREYHSRRALGLRFVKVTLCGLIPT